MKTNAMKRLERQYDMPIEEILRKLYIEESLSLKEVGERLIVSEGTVYNWLKMFDIRTRKMVFI